MKRERDGTIEALERRIDEVLIGISVEYERYRVTRILHFKSPVQESEARRRLEQAGLRPCPERPPQTPASKVLSLAHQDGDAADAARHMKKVDQLRAMRRGL
jgi:hypothetical protein